MSRAYSRNTGSQYEPGYYAANVQQRSNMTQREGIHKFENERIKTLQEERLHIQKKTFTKWMNSFLMKAKLEVEDLFVDLADGVKLLKLLEIISGEKLGKPNNGKMRVHKIENVNKSLAFLHTKVRLESIGAEDIVDGNPRLILGLIWTIILRFQIQEIEIDVDEENQSSEKRSAKDALLLWCQRKTHGYDNVDIRDFTGSWRSGLGFNALIHAHRPDLFDFQSLTPGRNIDNLNHAFDVAANELGIPRLLDAEDVDTQRPDEKSILTYVASYYHTFARMKNEQKSGKRIANIMGKLMDADKKKLNYVKLTTDLLGWIRQKTVELEKRDLPNSLEGIQKQLLEFKLYRTIEKPPKYKERSEIEALYFTINTLLKSLNQPQFTPQEGVLVNDIEKAWQKLEYAEHSREVALREELLRQEKLEQLNYKFEKKSVLREGYLNEMIQVLSDPRYGANLRQVDATVKKHEAISADILARVERFNDLTAMAHELEIENYHGKERVKNRETEVLEKWRELLKLLENHKNNLSQMSVLMNLLREIDTTLASIKELEVQFSSEDVGPHLLGVEELLQAHSVQELQVNTLGETQRRYQRQGQAYKNSELKEAPMLLDKLEELNNSHAQLSELAKERRARLEEARNFYHFLEDHDNEEGWLIDKQRICKTEITAKDLRAVLSLQQKHKALEDEMKVRKPKSSQITEVGKKLINDKHPRGTEVQMRLDSLKDHWKALEELVELRKRQLEDAAEAYQFYTDANETDSWLNEKMALVASDDYGVDEPSSQALLQRHRDLQGELNAYSGDILNLNQQADKLIKAGICTLELSGEPEQVPEPVEQEEWVNETRLVPKDVWEEVPVERLEHRTYTEQKLLPHVKASYAFDGQGMKMAKGEIMILQNKTNGDWWSVRKLDGAEGFVPANYVKEIEPRPVACIVTKPEKVKTVTKVKKTILVRQVVPVKRFKPATVSQVKPLLKRRGPDDTTDSNDSVEKRQKRINQTYDNLQDLAQRRHALLEDSICLFGFYRECDDFEKWIKDKEKLLKTDDESDNVETAKRKFEKFLTDLSASSKRIEALDMAVEDFTRQGHSQLDKIKVRQKQIHQLWDHLNYLKAQKEKNLEGASSVELFNRTCDEAKDWMNEKMTQLDTAELGPDLKTVQALQRRHQNLERELAPLEEKVSRVHLLGNSVKNSYPSERANVTAQQKEIQDMWKKVQDKAVERRSRLENAVGQQIFKNSANQLLAWIDSVKEQLNTDEIARDVETAENLLKKHNELGDEIKSHDDEFRELLSLGNQIIQRNPSVTEIPETMERIKAEQDAINRGWLEKQKFLQQCVELQIFNREADKIDATTKSHEAFLEYVDLGSSLDDVEAICKRHNDFDNSLGAQDKILKQFSANADKLIANNHYDAKYIDDRRNQVITKRNAVKNNSQARRQALEKSKDYQKFVAEAGDLNQWLSDKTKIASDESYRDLTNLPRKLQKHKAFERELRANEGQLRLINKDADALINTNNRPDEVKGTIDNLNKKWKNLIEISFEKGRRLEQAAAQREHNRSIEDAKLKLDELDSALRSGEVGNDLRSCKDLRNKHDVLEADIALWEQKIGELVTSGEDMAQEGHFDANKIKKESQNLQDRCVKMKVPLSDRGNALEESLKFHKYCFELDAELQWINDHLPLASSETMGQNLHQAQSLYKKHKKLEAEIEGHQAMINKALSSGQSLIDQKHPEKAKVEELCNNLTIAWRDLQDKANDRSKKLDLSLKAQQYLSEASEIESWLAERDNILRSTDYGRDRDSATKLLTKHKTIELELDTYSGILSEMGHTATAMVTANHPDSKTIAAKQQLIEKMFKSLQRLAGQRQKRLMESLYRHEYFLESAELEQWIKEQEQTAASEDYGQDYERLMILQNKFDDLQHRVEIGAERFNQCEESAKKLIASEISYATDIEKRQEQLGMDSNQSEDAQLVAQRHEIIRDSWENLLELMSQREQKLYAAGEIHRFHRDVAEALSRIQDKKAALSSELGKDLNSSLALLRKHEVFENDLVALEAQLQVLVEDSVKLQAKYPSNAAAIVKQQENVIENWEILKEDAALRSDQLAASHDLQNFLAQVRDLMSWASNLRATLQAEEHVSDAAGAMALKIQHEAIYSEIEAREEKFRFLNELSDSMVQTGHYAATEVEEKCTALLDERQKLHTAWGKKKILLEQKIDLFCFLRDAKQIDNLSSSQEAALTSSDFGQTVEDVQNQIKKHEAFEKLIAGQDEKASILHEHARKLIEQNHYESGLIGKRLDEVLDRRQKVKDLCAIRRNKLADALLYAQFVRDYAEAETWITEKQKKLEADVNNFTEVINLEDKIKKLQKHQAFQAEVAANEVRISEINDIGNRLIQKNHENSPAIRDMVKRVLYAWKLLLKQLDERGRGLDEAQDILEFNSQLDKIEAWIRDKEMMIQASDTGRDLEHCNALRRKLDDVDSDMRVDDQRVKVINVLADKLMTQGQVPNEMKVVDDRRNQFNAKWKGLQGALNNYRALLAGAYEVHYFYRDVNDTFDRIAEKALLMGSDDVGKDLTAVEGLIRKQEALERDMTAIHSKLADHDKEAAKLKKKYPEKAQEISEKVNELNKTWDNLQELSLSRKQTLKVAYAIHKFASDVRELEIWVNDIIKKMNSSPNPTTITESETQIELHQERKAEIDGRDVTFKQLQHHGENLVSSENSMKTKVNVEKSLQTLENLNKVLHNAWDERDRKLKHARQLQLFKAKADEVEIWLATKEAFLNNDDLGESFTAVEVLIKKHEAFEKLLSSNNYEELENFAKEIVTQNQEDSHLIKIRLDEVEARKSKLFEHSENRRKTLLESLQFQQFLRNLYEVERWLAQKMQIALDDNYRDPSNLQSKIQKHIAFDAELTANTNRVSSIISEGDALVDAKHYASEEILSQLEILETEWRKLQEGSKEKKECLNQAYDALIFGRLLDEFNSWMDDIESQLSSEDYGKDLASVNNLLKKHEMVEADVAHHSDVCDQIKETDSKFFKTNHFMKDEIHERAMNSVKRYYSLHEPTTIRRDNLEDSLLLHQYLRDAEDELDWLKEKEHIAASTDLGNSLTAVQSLQKKHQALESEILSQEPAISSVLQRGGQMLKNNHFAAEKIESRNNEIQQRLTQLRDLSSIRRLRLLDAVESQMFYAEANEAESWMKEKYPILASQDYGKDEDSVQSGQKKLEALQREIQSFSSLIEKIAKLAENLLDRGHFDHININQKNETIQKQFVELQQLAKLRDAKLLESRKLYEFIRNVEEVQEWVADQTSIAGLEEYGSDVEHVEQLIIAFDSFISNLGANEGRIIACVAKGEQLLNEKNPYKSLIKQRTEETKQLWEELKDLINTRQEALAGAKQVHVYDRTADETITWINEKETALLSEDYGQDLEAIQALVRKHEIFDTELAAVREQVEQVLDEAKKLGEVYPDAKDHIEVKREDMIEAWSSLLDKTYQRKEKLKQAEQLQAYFDEYRELMSWINEMLAKITAAELAKDVHGAELLLARTKEHQAEIDARKEAFDKFYKAGNKLVSEKHVFANEIHEKITVLEQRQKLLDVTLQKRKEIYELNLDTQIFLRDAEILESWIISREPQLKDTKMGENIPQVEDLLRRHEDFEKTVAAQDEKFQALKRITKLEQMFRKQKEYELAAKQAEKERIDRERVEVLKQKEVQRITEERRRNEANQQQNVTNGIVHEKPPIFSSPVLKSPMYQSPINQKHPPTRDVVTPISSVQKSNSFATLLGEKLRRGSEGNIKRAESMKIGPGKQAKRTPSFTTRRRASSFRKNQGDDSDFAAIEIQGLLERKHELQSGGKKSPVRSWKLFHTVLCGQLLCFFKDEDDFVQKKAATAPVNIHNARCERADDYTKRKNVFRLRLPDGSEFLFLASSGDDMDDWIKKLSFHASLPPNLQLLSYDESKKQSNSSPDIKAISNADQMDGGSSISSRASSPDSQRRDSASSRHNSFGSANSSTMSSPNTPQINFLQKQKGMREQQLEQLKISPSSGGVSPIPSPNNDYQGLSDKPPIPPRGMPPPIPQRQLSYEAATSVNYRNRNNSSESIDSANNNNYSNSTNNNTPQQIQRPYSIQPISPSHDELSRNNELRHSEKPPPLPISPQPQQSTAKMIFRNDKNNAEWYGNNHHNDHGNDQHRGNHHQHRQVVSATQQFIQSQAIETMPPPQSHQQPQVGVPVGIQGGGGGGGGGQGSRTTWHHHYIPNHDYNLTGTINSSTGIGFYNNNDAWGSGRFESTRPTSLPPSGSITPIDPQLHGTRASAESSSESESHSISSINSGKGGKDKNRAKFWPFKSKKPKEGGDKAKP